MVQSAPPDGATGPSRRPPEANGLTLRQSADAAAQRLADAGHTVELHPLVSNERGAPVLAAYASAFMIASLAALAAPLQSSALLAALLGCGLFDLEGRRSWFRGIVPREGARALLQWTRPGPSDGPVVIVAIPDEATRVRQTGVGPLVLAGLGIAALAGALARPFFADPAGPFLVSVALTSALVMLIALAVDRRGRVLADEGSGFRLAERIAAALEDSPRNGDGSCSPRSVAEACSMMASRCCSETRPTGSSAPRPGCSRGSPIPVLSPSFPGMATFCAPLLLAASSRALANSASPRAAV